MKKNNILDAIDDSRASLFRQFLSGALWLIILAAWVFVCLHGIILFT